MDDLELGNFSFAVQIHIVTSFFSCEKLPIVRSVSYRILNMNLAKLYMYGKQFNLFGLAGCTSSISRVKRNLLKKRLQGSNAITLS